MPNIPGAAVGAINFEKELRQGAAHEPGRHQDHVSGRAKRSGVGALAAGRTPARWILPSSASTAVSSRLPARAPIRPRASAAPTTAYGRRHWCRKFVSAVRIITIEAIGEDYGLKTSAGSRHQGHQPERLHQRHHGARRRRLQRLPDRLRDVAAVGSRREHLDGVDDRDEDVGQSHDEGRWRPALEPASARPGESSSRAFPIPRQPDGAQHRHGRSERLREFARGIHAGRAERD